MKRIFLVILVALWSTSLFGQLQIQTTDSVLLNNDDTLEIVPEVTTYFNVYNAADTAINYICLATEVVLPADAISYNICTNGVCSDVTSPGQLGNETVLDSKSYASPQPDIVYLNNGSQGEGFVRLKYQNRNNPDDTASICFSVNLLTALANVNGNDKLEIYPNPANENVHISYNVEQKSSLVIFDNTGRKVQTIELNNKKDEFYLNTADLQEGIYYIKIGDVANKMLIVH